MYDLSDHIVDHEILGVLSGGAGGSFSSLTLPYTTDAATGIYFADVVPFLHNFTNPTGFVSAATDTLANTRNIFLGFGSGNFTMAGTSSQGKGNVGVGDFVMPALTTGSQNGGFGRRSLKSVTTGGANNGFGAGSLELLLTGSGNTAGGAAALGSLTTGSENTAWGDSSGFTPTTGSNGVYLGAGADASGDFSNVIAIGFGTIATASNSIELGNASHTITNIYGVTTINVPASASYAGETILFDPSTIAVIPSGAAIANDGMSISFTTGDGDPAFNGGSFTVTTGNATVSGAINLIVGGSLVSGNGGNINLAAGQGPALATCGFYRFLNPAWGTLGLGVERYGSFDFRPLLTDRTYAWPNASGTVLLDTTAGGNPTALVGNSAVNGSATTFMRSDGAPALDLTLARNWSAGVHTFAARSIHELGITLGKSGVAGDGRIDSVTPDGSGVTSILLQPSVALSSDTTRHVARILDSTGTYGLSMYGDFSWVFGGNTGSNLANNTYIAVTGSIGNPFGINFGPTINASSGAAVITKATSITGGQFVAAHTGNAAPAGYVMGGAFAARTGVVTSGNIPAGYIGAGFCPADLMAANSGKTFAQLGGWRVFKAAPTVKNTGTFTSVYGGYIENQTEALSGTDYTNLRGLIIEEMTGGGTTNVGIELQNATAGYKAITIRDANAWYGSSAAGTNTIGGTIVELNIGGNIELSVAANATTVRDAHNFILNATTGTKIATATTQKLGFWNAAPVAQYATTGTLTGFTANTTTPVLDGSTFTGNTGATAYTIGDIVRALKLAGIMAS